MKRKLLITIFLIASVISTLTICSAEESNNISVYYNGEKINCEEYGQEATIVDGRTLVPLRAIFEAIGATVDWDPTTKTVTSKLNDTEISLAIGKKFLLRNGERKELDVPAQIINNRTMIPVRAVSEAFGVDVQWDSTSRSVMLQVSSVSRLMNYYSDSVFSVIAVDENGYEIQTGNGVFIDKDGIGVVALNSIIKAKQLYISFGKNKAEIQGILDMGISHNWAIIKTDCTPTSFVDLSVLENYELSDEVCIISVSVNDTAKSQSSRIIDKLYKNASGVIVTKLAKTLTDKKYSGCPVYDSDGSFLGILIIDNDNNYLIPNNLYNSFSDNNLIKPQNLKFDENGVCSGSNYYDILIEDINTFGVKSEETGSFLWIGNHGEYGNAYLLKSKDGLSVVFEESDSESYLVKMTMTINPNSFYSNLSYFFGTSTRRDNNYYYKHIANSFINNTKFSKNYEYRLKDVRVNNHEFSYDIVQESDLEVIQNEFKKYHMILLEMLNEYTKSAHGFEISAFGFPSDVLYN